MTGFATINRETPRRTSETLVRAPTLLRLLEDLRRGITLKLGDGFLRRLDFFVGSQESDLQAELNVAARFQFSDTLLFPFIGTWVGEVGTRLNPSHQTIFDRRGVLPNGEAGQLIFVEVISVLWPCHLNEFAGTFCWRGVGGFDLLLAGVGGC